VVNRAGRRIDAIGDRIRHASLTLPVVALFALVAAVIQTWPLVLHADDQIMHDPQQPGDMSVFFWDLWWMKESIVVLQVNPFHTDYLFFPHGTDLYLHPLIPLTGITSIPFQVVTGNLLLSWNLLLLVFLVLSAVGAFALVRRLTGDFAAAAISAYAFAFAPSTMMHLQAGEWNIAGTWPLPFLVLFLLRVHESGRLRDALAAGFFGAAITYNWIEFGLDAALFVALFVAYWTFRAWRAADRDAVRTLWRNSAAMVALWGILCLPIAFAAWNGVHGGDYETIAGVEYWSSDLAAFVRQSPLWGPGEAPIFPVGPHLGIGSPLGTWYLGLVPLALALFALRAFARARPMVPLWIAAFFVFTVLSLGPYLYIDGDKSFSILGVSFSSIPLPYQLYDHLPAFGDRRIPARMLVFAVFALSVLAGIGSSVILQWLRPRWAIAAPIAAALIFAMVAFDSWNPPVWLWRMETSTALQQIADEPGDFSVLQLPLGRADGATVAGDVTGTYIVDYYQTIYRKRSFGGYIGRASSSTLAWIGQEPGFRYLACTLCTEPESPEDVDPKAIRPKFIEYRIKYVIIHKLYPEGDGVPFSAETMQKFDTYLRDVAGLELALDDAEQSIYKNPEID